MNGVHCEDLAVQAKLSNKGAQRFWLAALTILEGLHPVDHAALVAKGTDNRDEILKSSVAATRGRGNGLAVQGNEIVAQIGVVAFDPVDEILGQKLFVKACQYCPDGEKAGDAVLEIEHPRQFFPVTRCEAGKAFEPLTTAQDGHDHNRDDVLQPVSLPLPSTRVVQSRQKIKHFVLHDSPIFVKELDFS